MNGKSDFDRELEEYLSDRKKSRFLHNVFKAFKSGNGKVKLNPELETYEVKQEEVQQTIEEEQPIKGKGFFSWLFGVSPDEEVSQQTVENLSIKDDLKNIAKVTINVLKKLPQQELTSFKNSDEYAQLKDTLKKHNLIK